MPSATERSLRIRRWLEWGCRAGVFALIAWMLFDAVRDDERPAAAESLRAADLLARLEALTHGDRSVGIHVDAERTLDPVERSWLRALSRNGRHVSWSGDAPAMAIDVEPVADPSGGTRLSLAAPPGRWILLADDAGAIDSVRATGLGVELRLPVLEGAVEVTMGGSVARSSPTDSIALRTVVVLGRPSWETRFVVAALEESGWRVSLRAPVAPDRAVEQGTIALDTARTATVIALDSTAGQEATSIARFVRNGGGLVMTAEAAMSRPAFAAMSAGEAGPVIPAALAESGDSLTRVGLALRPLAPRADAVPLERRDRSVAVAARRVGAGRVVQLGYGDTWRWRMSGGDSGVVAHRRWWSGLVAAVAHAPITARETTLRVLDPAPFAATVQAIGPPRSLGATQRADGPIRPGTGALWITLALLLTEWTSRRLRGAS
jgi:hypothetical protein